MMPSGLRVVGRLPDVWPSDGAIDVQSLVVRYRPELDPVLNGLSFSVKGTCLSPYLLPRSAPLWLSTVLCQRPWIRHRQSASATVERHAQLSSHLSDLMCTVCMLLPRAGREKVGIAGRTGCGKSTLMMALKRVMEPAGGHVLIDGVDIAAVPLFELRSRLALVPQARLRDAWQGLMASLVDGL